MDNQEDQNKFNLYNIIASMTRECAFSNKIIIVDCGGYYYSNISMILEELFANYLTLKLMNADK